MLNFAYQPFGRAFEMVEGHLITGMTLSSSEHSSIVAPEGLQIKKANLKDIDQYVEVMAAGWDSREIDTKNAAERMRRDFDKGDFFWVFCDGKPIATGETQYVSLSGYLSGSSVTPEYRGRGAYRLLVKARLQAMEERDVKTASTIALVGTSAPVLRKIGFSNPIPIRYFSWTSH